MKKKAPKSTIEAYQELGRAAEDLSRSISDFAKALPQDSGKLFAWAYAISVILFVVIMALVIRYA